MRVTRNMVNGVLLPPEHPKVEIVPQQPEEYGEAVLYRQTETGWGIRWYYDDAESLPFTANDHLYIFARRQDAWLGTVGSASDLEDDTAEVAVIFQDGRYGIAASSLRECFELFHSVPDWLDRLTRRVPEAKDIETALEARRAAAAALELAFCPDALRRLAERLAQPTRFQVYDGASGAPYEKITELSRQ